MTPAEQIEAAYAQYQELAVLAPLRAQSPLVPGSGSLNAPVMLIGEAPGATEVEQLRPFVGQSGRFLNTMLAEAGLPRRYCYVTNVLLYRPPGNRTPETFEIVSSRHRLEQEILAVRPALIITLGAVARRCLCPNGSSVTVIHGKPFVFGLYGTPGGLEPVFECGMLPTFHPSAALRDSSVHAMMRNDLRFLGQFAV